MTYCVTIKNNKKKFPLKGLNELLVGRIYNQRLNHFYHQIRFHILQQKDLLESLKLFHLLW